MKPMLASDYDESKLKFPLGVQPKIDGVRALNMTGQLTGRSLEPHANKYVTALFSHPLLVGFDGEMAAERETHPRLCNLTTSALNTIAGEPFIVWHLFDYVGAGCNVFTYDQRYKILEERLAYVRAQAPHLSAHLALVPMARVGAVGLLREIHASHVAAGYEGTILRHLHQPHKQGRSTVKEGGLLRIKDMAEEEAVVVSITEGQRNGNEATTNALGLTERSTHQENMTPNGMVGSLECTDVKTGQRITVGAGKMTHAERAYYFAHPHELIGRTIKYQTFKHGVKDRPRFPTFQSLRAPSDIGG